MSALPRLSSDPWLAQSAREQVRDAIVAIERQTGAEVVVTVARRAGDYRHADARFGALLSLLALLAYYFYPAPLPDDLALLVVVLCYPLGAAIAAVATPLRRLLVRKRLLRDNLRLHAQARFVEQGIGKTRGRTGVLVFVSRFERGVEVVPDLGIPVASMGETWSTATQALDTAARGKELAPFLTALALLGRALAAAVPRAADDQNELPDEVSG
jgi:putative membrane protein